MIRLIRQVLQWAPEIKGKLVIAAVFKVLETMFMGAPYAFIFFTLNDLLAGTLDVKKVIFYTLGMAVCFLLQGVFFFLFARTAWPAANYLVKKLRIRIGEHLRKLSMGYFSEKTTGSLNTLVADEMQAVQVVVYSAFPDFIVAVTFATLIPLCLLFVDWRLTLIAVAVIPAAVPFYTWQKRVMDRGLRKRFDSISEVNSQTIEYIQGIKVLKAFKKTGKQAVKFRRLLENFRDLAISVIKKAEMPLTLTKVILDLGLCLILFFATSFLLDGTITLTIFLIFLILGLRIYEPLKLLIPSSGMIKYAEPAINKIKDMLETDPLPQPNTDMAPASFDVQLTDVTFSYDTVPVLQNVAFTVPEKTITALVGPSGSGKTTITRLIARFWDVDAGEVKIGGRNIKEMKIDTLLGQISMVFQDVYLFNDTIYQNIAYGSRNATTEKIIEAAKTAQCHDFISKLPQGYETTVGEGGATLSGGEKQRISIARAILKDAPIILLDEATASVDPENESMIQNAINSLVASKSLIIIAHRLSTIVSADQIVVLNKTGRIEEIGTHEALLQNNGLYAKLWQSRIQAKKWRIAANRSAPSNPHNHTSTEEVS